MENESHFLSSPQLRTIDGDIGFAVAWEVMRPYAERSASQLTTDLDLWKELVQEARVKLWRLGPTRFRLSDREEVLYLHGILRNHLFDVWGAKPANRSAKTDAEREERRAKAIAELREVVERAGAVVQRPLPVIPRPKQRSFLGRTLDRVRRAR